MKEEGPDVISTRAVITDNFTTINPSTDGFSPLDPINGWIGMGWDMEIYGRGQV